VERFNKIDERDRKEEWAHVKSRVLEEFRQGWTPETIAKTLNLDIDIVRDALAEIDLESERGVL